MSVLVVDDAPQNIMLLQVILESEGYTVLTADNGPQAREIAHREKPGIILLDIMMPGENGFETCTKLKQSAVTADIPVIFISSLNDSKNIIEGLTVGGIDYISKPFNQDEVLARVKNYLKLRNHYLTVIDEQAARLRQVQDAQQSILIQPDDLPAAKFGIIYEPVLEAGGDFYDVFEINPGAFGYCAADISGHDLGASFATSALKALLRQNASPLHTPDETFRMMNSVLLTIFAEGQHLTAVFAVLNRNTNLLQLVNAAHLPMLYLPAGKEPEWLDTPGDILGVFESALFTSRTIQVAQGDRFFLFTDGLLESFRERTRNRETGKAELFAYAVKTRTTPVQQAVTDIFRQMFADNRKREDDVVLLGVDI